jgi:hypothetical protein
LQNEQKITVTISKEQVSLNYEHSLIIIRAKYCNKLQFVGFSGKQATIYRRPAVTQVDGELVTQTLRDDGAHKPDEADGKTSGKSLSNSSPNLTETGTSAVEN